MTTEKTVEVLEHIKTWCGLDPVYGTEVEALDAAISAIRFRSEQEDKSGPSAPDKHVCWLCENEGKSILSLELSEVFIVEPVKYTRIGDGYEHNAPLNFCPVCGRSLPRRGYTRKCDA